MTKQQFFNQNKNFEDKYYYYAIHITDGGAMYLYQADKDFIPLDDTDEISYMTIRLDGTFLGDLVKWTM